MSVTVSKKQRERAALDRLLNFLRMTPDEINDWEGPDFILRYGGRTTGVEVMRLFQPNDGPGASLKERESVQDRLIARACAIHRERGGQPLWVDFTFSIHHRLRKQDVERLASLVATMVGGRTFEPDDYVELERDWSRSDDSFPPEIDRITVARRLALTKPHWHCTRAGFEWPLRPVDVSRAIGRKQARVEAYRTHCTDLWLLLAVEGTGPSSFIDVSEQAREHAYETAFDRVFMYLNFGAGIIEFSIEGRAE